MAVYVYPNVKARFVVAFESEERVWFRYDGKQAKKKTLFYPRNIFTDASNTFNNDCLHIITQSGHLVAYFDNCELHKPCWLSVDNTRRLLVGLYESRKIKVIKYCK